MLNSKYNTRRKHSLRGDLNGHVGSVLRSFEGVHVSIASGKRKGEGKSILYFMKWYEHIITYKSVVQCSHIYFFLIKESNKYLFEL